MFLSVYQAFSQCDDGRYLTPVFSSTRTHENLVYNQAYALQGACALESNQAIEYYALDVYEPDGDTISKRPCIVYAHGGAFLIGDKRIIPVDQYCYEMAKRGFVVFSIDYRKCFNTVSTPSIERAVYRAVQDMKAAVRWVKAKADTFRVDTNQLFVGGNSAGSIMAIFATYGDEDERQAIPSTYNNPDLGCMDCSGNYYPGPSKAKAVLNYWGATLDTNIIEAGDPPMLSMHGNQDNAVPFGHGVPFSYPAFPQVNGSFEITARLNHLGIPNQLYVFDGMGHEPWLTDPNQLDTIVEKSSQFLYDMFLKPTPPVIVGASDVCRRDTVEYLITNAVAASTYCWTVTNGAVVNVSANGSAIRVAWNNAGNAGLSVVESNRWQGVSEARNLAISVHQNPSVLVSPDITICEGLGVQVVAYGGSTYSWSPNVNISDPNVANPVVFPTQTQTYTVMVSNAACTSIDSVVVTIIPAPFVSAGNDVNICQGEDGQLDAWAEGQLYIWSPTAYLDHPYFIHPQASPPITTLYTFTTIDTITGCQSSDQVVVFVHDLPPVPEIFQGGDSLLTYLGYAHQWLLNGNEISGATNSFYVPSVSGAYTVEVTDTNGCSNISLPYAFTVGIEEVNKPEYLIYPNPASDELFVKGARGFNISVRDATGKQIISLKINDSLARLDVSSLPSGIYFIEIENSKGRFAYKFARL